MKNFIFHKLPFGEKIPAVYKMIFDDGSYYIGSALNIRQRMTGWKSKLNRGLRKNYRITEAFNKTNNVIFEIVEIIEDPIFRRFREDGYIKIHFGKPLCLNIAPSSFNNIGVKQNPNRIKRDKCYNEQPVVKLNDNGDIIERYKSVAQASLKNNVSDISRCFLDSIFRVKGMVFRKIDIDGNIIPAPFIPRSKRVSKLKGRKLSEEQKRKMKESKLKRINAPDYQPIIPKHSVKVNQFDLNGNLIKTFVSISSAAKEMKADSKNFKRQIKDSPRNYYKGFIFKYA